MMSNSEGSRHEATSQEGSTTAEDASSVGSNARNHVDEHPGSAPDLIEIRQELTDLLSELWTEVNQPADKPSPRLAEYMRGALNIVNRTFNPAGHVGVPFPVGSEFKDLLGMEFIALEALRIREDIYRAWRAATRTTWESAPSWYARKARELASTIPTGASQ